MQSQLLRNIQYREYCFFGFAALDQYKIIERLIPKTSHNYFLEAYKSQILSIF